MEENKENLNNEEINNNIDSEDIQKSSESETTQPPKFETEKEWAETLGMNFDPEKAEIPTPPAPDEFPTPDGFQSVPPIYAMNPDMELPPVAPQEPMPPTYMVWAILSTLCCCMPAGVLAIVFSAMVSSKYYARDFEGAKRASRLAEIWIIVSIVTGVIGQTLYFPLMMTMGSV